MIARALIAVLVLSGILYAGFRVIQLMDKEDLMRTLVAAGFFTLAVVLMTLFVLVF